MWGSVEFFWCEDKSSRPSCLKSQYLVVVVKMAVKVVNGLVGRIEPERVPNAPQARSDATATPSAAHTAFASSFNASYARSFASSDAAVSALRSTRISNPDKVRSTESAEKLADSISDRVKSEENLAGSAHDGLSPSTGRASLVT